MRCVHVRVSRRGKRRNGGAGPPSSLACSFDTRTTPLASSTAPGGGGRPSMGVLTARVTMPETWKEAEERKAPRWPITRRLDSLALPATPPVLDRRGTRQSQRQPRQFCQRSAPGRLSAGWWRSPRPPPSLGTMRPSRRARIGPQRPHTRLQADSWPWKEECDRQQRRPLRRHPPPRSRLRRVIP